MSYDLRNHIYATAVPRILNGNFSADIDIIFPDAGEQTLKGVVLYDTEQIDPVSGDLISVKNTWLVISKADLDQEINQGDVVYFRFPIRPGSSTQIAGTFDGHSSTFIDGDSAGFIRLPMMDTEQEI